MTDVMQLSWIAAAIVVPSTIAVAVALPLWFKASDSIGSIAGAGVVFVACIALIGREYVHVQRVTNACLQAEVVCAFRPEPFTRFCVYGFIALIEAFALFVIGLRIEERVRRRAYAAEWQSR
jgi:hypothetical protein